MNLNKENWQAKDYQEYLKYLKSLQDLDYLKFHRKLVQSKYEFIGIRLPQMRQIVKEIKKGNALDFLKLAGNHYYEEVMITGLLIASISDISKIETFIPKIDNWAICDSFCASLKFIKKKTDKYLDFFLSLTKSTKEFTARVGLIVLLDYYINNEYIDIIFKAIDQITLDKYYVNMAIAWLLCECYIKLPEKCEDYFLKTKINKFTFNKTISKIRESYRISKDKKEYLNTLKRS